MRPQPLEAERASEGTNEPESGSPDDSSATEEDVMAVHHIRRAPPPSEKPSRERPTPLLTSLVLLTVWACIGYHLVSFCLPTTPMAEGDWSRLLPFVPRAPNLEGTSPYDLPKKVNGADVRPSKGLPPVHAT